MWTPNGKTILFFFFFSLPSIHFSSNKELYIFSHLLSFIFPYFLSLHLPSNQTWSTWKGGDAASNKPSCLRNWSTMKKCTLGHFPTWIRLVINTCVNTGLNIGLGWGHLGIFLFVLNEKNKKLLRPKITEVASCDWYIINVW